MSLWPNKGEADPRPAQGEGYRRARRREGREPGRHAATPTRAPRSERGHLVRATATAVGDASPCTHADHRLERCGWRRAGGGSPATPPRQRPRAGVTRCPEVFCAAGAGAAGDAGGAVGWSRHEAHSAAYGPSAATSSSWVPISLTTPSSTTATRSASCAVCSRCAIATTVRPSTTAASERSRCRAARGSSSDVASSSTRVCGSASTRRARATCCDWASPSACPPLPTTVSRPSGSSAAHSWASTARSASSSSSRVRAGPGEQEVVGERADEDVVLLGDQGDLAAQLAEGEVDQRHAADVDASLARTVDAGHQPAERRLARAGRADDGEPLAGSQVERRPRAARRGRGGRRSGRRRPSRSAPSGCSPGRGRGRAAPSPTPMTRASDVAPTWISSSQLSTSSSGSTICWM